MKIVLVTGGFDPLHSGHIEYFRSAKSFGDQLIVGLNSDEWLARKKGQPFMPLSERRIIVGNLKDVTATIVYNDDDGSSCKAIEQLLLHCSPDDELIFANGGDRTKENIPEMSITDSRVKFMFGVGGENKINSSSWILRQWDNWKN
jgi:cytidyltransferase-like protein